jgi:hypothetical protein
MNVVLSNSPFRDSWKGACYFAALGPVFGSLGFGAYMSRYGLLSGHVTQAADTGLSTALLLLIGAHFAGFIPAAACGLVLGPFRPTFFSWLACFFAGTFGAAAAVAYWLWIHTPGESPLIYAIAGFSGALVTARIFAIRVPNNSFKPTPLRGAA